jgi:hypothetical protein
MLPYYLARLVSIRLGCKGQIPQPMPRQVYSLHSLGPWDANGWLFVG